MNVLIRYLALSLCALMGTLPSAGMFAQQVTTDSALAQQATAIMQNRCMVCHGCYDAPC